jgi:hypothetical protein
MRKRHEHKQRDSATVGTEELKELELLLSLVVIKYGPPTESRRNRALMPNGFAEVGGGRSVLFNISNEPVQPGKAVEFLCVSKLGRVK